MFPLPPKGSPSPNVFLCPLLITPASVLLPPQCKLKAVPEAVLQLGQLQELLLGFNRIDRLPYQPAELQVDQGGGGWVMLGWEGKGEGVGHKQFRLGSDCAHTTPLPCFFSAMPCFILTANSHANSVCRA